MACLISTEIQRVKELGFTNMCEFPGLDLGTSGGYIELGEEI
jgi:hypothetical protein